MKTALKMLTGLVWLMRGERAFAAPTAVPAAPDRAALLAAVAHHRRAAAKCAAAGDEEGQTLHEKHAGRYAAEAGALEGGS